MRVRRADNSEEIRRTPRSVRGCTPRPPRPLPGSEPERDQDRLATASHEMKAPLSAILGTCEMLATTPLDAGQQQYLGVLRSNAAALSRLVDDLLAASRPNRPAEFDPIALLDDVTDMFRLQAARAGLRLDLVLDSELPARVVADAPRIRQVLANLVGNAIRFTSRGRIVLRARAADSSLRFTVTDTGPGIPEEQQAAIFDRFVTLDGVRSSGAGLGLAINRDLAERMNGRLWVRSRVGKGSAFFFEVPVTGAARSARHAEGVVACGFGRETLRSLRNLLGFVDEFASAAQALAAATDSGKLLVLGGERLAAAEPEALRRYGAAAADGRLRVVIVAEPGWNGSTLPPAFGNAVLFGPMRLGTVRDAASLRQSGQPRVLVVDDDPDVSFVVGAMLEDAGCVVGTTDCGAEAVERACAGSWDIILLDLEMGYGGGETVAAQIRACERASESRRIPIVAMTGHAYETRADRCRRSGMDDYLCKPVGQQQLMDKVGFWTSQRVRSAALPAGAAPLASRFLENRWADASAVDEAVAAGNLETVRLIGHKLKGSGAGFGFEAISEIGREMEKAARSGDVEWAAAANNRLRGILGAPCL